MGSVKRRLERLEALAGMGAPGTWFDLETWKKEHAEGVPLDEQERRRLAEHPEQADEIRAQFARIRARLAAIAGLEELPSDADPNE